MQFSWGARREEERLCLSLMHLDSTYSIALPKKFPLSFLLMLILMIISWKSETTPSSVHLSHVLN